MSEYTRESSNCKTNVEMTTLITESLETKDEILESEYSEEITEELDSKIEDLIEELVKQKGRELTDDEIREVIESVLKSESVLSSIETLNPPCLTEGFNIQPFLTGDKTPPITKNVINNLKRVHSELLLPIFNYYKDKDQTTSCSLQIINGLITQKETMLIASGHAAGLHKDGMAVDFVISSVSDEQVFEEIQTKKINIEYGVLVLVNGVHITLPYKVGNQLIKGLSVNSVNGFLEYKWE
jgi:hypothetical protein